MVVVDSQESSDSIPSKVQDEKLTKSWYMESLWFGPCRRMPYEFAEARNKYPKIPAEKVDGPMGEGITNKLFRALNIEPCSMRVREHFKGREVVKRTILVTGGSVKKLEAAAERINKQQQKKQ